jgi:dTDP-4-amino-4,6-dideoxygalactose transaminase
MLNVKKYNFMDFNTVEIFEKEIASFFGSPYAVAVDSCTHGIEICLRHLKSEKITVPVRTYISIPFLANKIGINMEWSYSKWKDYYFLTEEIADAAVLWKRNSYIKDKFMCISFQYQKHLSLGRGGAILCPDLKSYKELKKISYDGRVPNIPWRDQNIKTIGYHYYMTPETAQLGLNKIEGAKIKQPRDWKYEDWPDISRFEIFTK